MLSRARSIVAAKIHEHFQTPIDAGFTTKQNILRKMILHELWRHKWLE